MPLLTRKKQLVLKEEYSAGFFSGNLETASDAAMLVFDAQLNPEVELLDRDFIRDSISPLKQAPAQKTATLTFTTEMIGTEAGTFAAGQPVWSRILLASGFRSAETASATIGTFSAGGPFRHGEIVTNDTGGYRARVLHDCHDGDNVIYLEIIDASFTNGAITGGSSGAQATISALDTDIGYTYYPISRTINLLTVTTTADLDAGDVVEVQNASAVSIGRAIVVESASSGATSVKVEFFRGYASNAGTDTLHKVTAGVPGSSIGTISANAYEQNSTVSASLFEDGLKTTMNAARAQVTFSAEVNRPMNIQATFQGRLDTASPSTSGGTGDRPMLTGIDYNLTTPPLFESSAITIARNDATLDGNDPIEPCITSITIDTGNNLVQRQCAGASEGLEEFIITGRDGTVSMDPEATLENDFGWLDSLLDSDVVRMDFTIGSTLGNKFRFTMPGLQPTQANSTDRDGVFARDVSLRLTGGDMHNLDGAAVTLPATGGDNEVVITYFTS